MYFWLPDTSTFLEDLILQEFENIPHDIESLNNKKFGVYTKATALEGSKVPTQNY